MNERECRMCLNSGVFLDMLQRTYCEPQTPSNVIFSTMKSFGQKIQDLGSIKKGTKAQSRRKNKRKKVQGDSSIEMSQNESSASVPTGNVILPTAYMSSPPPNTGQVYHIMANGQNFATSTPVSGQYITSHNNGQNNNTILEELLKRLESVDQKLSKLDMIEHKVMAIEQKLVTVDSVMTDLTK